MSGSVKQIKRKVTINPVERKHNFFSVFITNHDPLVNYLYLTNPSKASCLPNPFYSRSFINYKGQYSRLYTTCLFFLLRIFTLIRTKKIAFSSSCRGVQPLAASVGLFGPYQRICRSYIQLQSKLKKV